MTHESENVYTKRRDDGMFGLYSRKLFRTGETILNMLNGDLQDDQDFRSIELDSGHFHHPDGMFANHSCDPSVSIEKDTGLLIALRSIRPNDEITFDYRTTETEIVAGFICKCGADNCAERIGS